MTVLRRPLAPSHEVIHAHVRAGRRRLLGVLVCILLAAPAASAASGAVTDGSAVLNVGRLHLNITNWGLIGSRYSYASAFSNAASAQWPGGTANEYLYSAGLWVGARRGGKVDVSSAEPYGEFTTATGERGVMYEARERTIVRPDRRLGITGVPGDLPDGDDDGDGRRDEDRPDGIDQDGDGLIDEDFAQRGSQMFSCSIEDDTPLSRELNPDHEPLGVRVYQEACAWDEPGHEDVVGLRFTVANVSTVPLEDVYVGIYVDGDVARHGDEAGGMDDMAGLFTGLVRQREGYWEDFAYGWIRDAATDDALPGWFGTMIDGSGFGDQEAVRPVHFGVHSLRVLNLKSAHRQIGLPRQDEELYDLMADRGRDRNPPDDQTGNYALLLTVGPYKRLEPGEHCVVNVGLAIAPSFEMLQNRIRTARELMVGRPYDADRSGYSGWGGRETLMCAEDFHPVWNARDNPIYDHFHGYWDDTCMPPGLSSWPIEPDHLFVHPVTRKHCIWVSTDNCDECSRYWGRECNKANPGSAPCGSSARSRGACTGVNGKETGLAWVSDVALPPSPWVRAVPRNGAVEVFWDDRSENRPDDLTGDLDFQSYRVWQAANWTRPAGTDETTGPPVESWSLQAEFDRIDYQPPRNDHQRMPFGRNTGLEGIAYRPRVLDDPRYEGLAEAMESVVLSDKGAHWQTLPPLRDRHGAPVPGLEALLPWEDQRAVLDTFFAVTPRPAEAGRPKRAVKYYRFRDEDVHNGFIYFYAVTATDHVVEDGGTRPVAPGSGRLPSGAFVSVVPGVDAVESGPDAPPVYVYPNPATRESLAEFQALSPGPDDPSGLRVAFANLPRCRCRISIFTLAGDLVQTLEHDGSTGEGQTSWNLVSRNGQTVVSGIYLYVVEPLASEYERAIGKFVVIL